MRTGILLSVRAKATRLPDKVFLPLYDGNVTESLLRRLARSMRADCVVLATSTHRGDDELAALAAVEGVQCYRGSPDDKLIRYRDAARACDLDFVVVVDGDDPFVSVTHIDRLIEYTSAQAEDVDLVSFANLPLGASAWVIGAPALETICAGRDEANTEVWGNLFRSDERFRVVDLIEHDPLLAKPEVRMTLDYETDYRFMTAVSDALRERGSYPSFEAVMELLAEHPELTELNRAAQSAYEAHFAASVGP